MSLPADSVHSSTLVSQVINRVMVGGKKSTAEQIVYAALSTRSRSAPAGPRSRCSSRPSSRSRPSLEVRSRRVGGANYQVPIEVPARRARTLAVRWIVTFARQRREREMVERLAAEILDAINQQGGAFKRKDDMYRMAQANKAFAHYRW